MLKVNKFVGKPCKRPNGTWSVMIKSSKTVQPGDIVHVKARHKDWHAYVGNIWSKSGSTTIVSTHPLNRFNNGNEGRENIDEQPF